MATQRKTTNLVKVDNEVGAKLYAPTPGTPKFRLEYTDPFTGARCQPKRTQRSDALALWDDTIEYLSTARLAAPMLQAPTPAKRSGTPTVNDLFNARVHRWSDDGASDGYVATRSGRYDFRMRPVFGDIAVRDWAASSDGCREVLRSARVQGLAPSSVQDLGAIMRTMVTLGHELRWISPGLNPMQGVRYTKRATEQGQSVEFVREDDRPEFAAVERLFDAYEELAAKTGILWLPTRARLAAQSGLRPGEQDALRICDLRPHDLQVSVEGSMTWSRGSSGPVRKLPKNGKRRQVLITKTLMERLADLAERRRFEGAADNGLLFEDPKRPGRPISEAATRRHHITASIGAGWETVEVRRRSESRRHLGPDRRPRHSNYTLRHHSAVWMHEVAGFDWTDVSRALGHHSVAFTYAVYVRSGADADSRNRARLRDM